MRKQKTITLEPGVTVTVLELRPRDIKHVMSLMQNGGDFDFEKLLTEGWDDALTKIGGVIQAEGVELQDLSFSEIEEVQTAFAEVNASFFALLKKLGLNLAVAGLPSSDPSTEPASP